MNAIETNYSYKIINAVTNSVKFEALNKTMLYIADGEVYCMHHDISA